MPPMNATGTNTAANTSAIATTGPDTSSMASRSLPSAIEAVFDVVHDRFHHDDGIVHHDTDGQHHAQQRKRIDGEAEQRETR